MTKQKKSQKSRRRFLADMLFLGGGVTAAALLAKSSLGTGVGPPDPPAVVGAMVPPSPQTDPTPQSCEVPETPNQPMPGEPVPLEPQVEGRMKAPDPPPSQIDGDVVAPSPRPAVKGEMIAPNPAGGARPIQRPDSP